jgi:hypothetical protein
MYVGSLKCSFTNQDEPKGEIIPVECGMDRTEEFGYGFTHS